QCKFCDILMCKVCGCKSKHSTDTDDDTYTYIYICCECLRICSVCNNNCTWYEWYKDKYSYACFNCEEIVCFLCMEVCDIKWDYGYIEEGLIFCKYCYDRIKEDPDSINNYDYRIHSS